MKPDGLHEHHLAIARTARYFTIGMPGAGITDVWFALHGYAQLAASFARQCAPLEAPNRLVVIPEALSRFYLGDHTRPAGADAKVGASWMTREDRLSEIADYVAYLDHLYRAVFKRIARADAGVHVLGFSQGAPTATRWAARGEARIDRLVLWGAPSPSDLDPGTDGPRLAALREVVMVAGDRDDYVTEKVISGEQAKFHHFGANIRVVRYSGGHALDPTTLHSLSGQSNGQNTDR